jgi:hypothetical protein
MTGQFNIVVLSSVFYLISVLLPFSVFSQSSQDNYTESKKNYSTDGSSTSDYLSKFEINPWNVDNIAPIINEGILSRSSIDSLLEFLHEKSPSLFSFPALAFHSRSLHSATVESPRAILMSSNAKTLMAFNGDENQSGGNRLEIIQFDPEQNQYAFIEIKQDRSKLSMQSNPEACFSCHTNHAPIWDGYNAWPRFLTSIPEGEREPEREKMARMWETFKSKAGSHPRYKQLDITSLENKFSDFGLERTTMGIQFWNLKRLADLIRQKDPDGKYSDLIKESFALSYGNTVEMESLDLDAAVKNHPEINRPNDFIEKLSKISGVNPDVLLKQYQQHLQKTFEAEKLRYQDQIALSKFLNGVEESPSTDVVVLAHLQIILNQIGIDLQSFGIGTSAINYDFSTPRHGVSDIVYWLSDSERKQRAHTSLQSSLPSNASHILFAQCASCHSDGLRGPKLVSFQNEKELKTKLGANPDFGKEIISRIKSLDVNERMPYGYPSLTTEQVLAVEQLLRKLETPDNCNEASSTGSKK